MVPLFPRIGYYEWPVLNHIVPLCPGKQDLLAEETQWKENILGSQNEPIIHLNVSLHSKKKIPHQPSLWLPVNGGERRGEVNTAPFKPSEEINTYLQDIEVGKGWETSFLLRKKEPLSLSQSLARKLSATLLYKWQIPAYLLNYSKPLLQNPLPVPRTFFKELKLRNKAQGLTCVCSISSFPILNSGGFMGFRVCPWAPANESTASAQGGHQRGSQVSLGHLVHAVPSDLNSQSHASQLTHRAARKRPAARWEQAPSFAFHHTQPISLKLNDAFSLFLFACCAKKPLRHFLRIPIPRSPPRP